MKHNYTIGEFKARLPEAIEAVREGHEVTVTYGRSRRAVAVLSPPKQAKQPRKLGRLAGKVKAHMAANWKMGETEFLDS